MTKHKFDFDLKKLQVVDIETVRPNEYNPKNPDTKEFKNVVKSLKTNGLTIPIIVREDPENKGQFIIIDGQHRYLAAKELEYKEIPIYNEGVVDEARAKQLTIFYQVQVPFSEIDLSYLVVELANLEMELPYTEQEILDFRDMAEFDFDYDRKEPEQDDSDDGLVPYSIRMTQDQLEVFKRAIDIIKEDADCSDGRACELLAAEYISGYSVENSEGEEEEA